MTALPEYGNWATVPDSMKTKTGLGKLGLKLGADQRPVAVKTHWDYGIKDYYLYAVAEAVPKRKVSEKQRNVLAAARLRSLTCSRCGSVQRHHSDLTKKKRLKRLCEVCVLQAKKDAARQRAIEWSRDVLAAGEALILDTETTGLGNEDEVIQLGIVDLGGRVLFDSLFRPTVEVSPGAFAVHGIGEEVLRTAPAFSQRYEEIVAIIGVRPVLIYHAAFDERLIMATIGRYGLPEPPWVTRQYGAVYANNWYCVMEQFARFYGEWSDFHQSYTWKPLAFAVDYLGRTVVGEHEVAGDCLMTLEVIKGMRDFRF